MFIEPFFDIIKHMNKITGRRNSFAFIAIAVAVIIAATAYFVFKAPLAPLPKAENIEKQSEPEAVLPTENATIQQPETEVASTSETTTKQKIAPEPETTLESKVAPVTTSPPASQSVFDPKSAGNPHHKIAASPPPCCNHPYWHKVYRAVSSDGLNFKEVGGMIKDKASVPAILQKGDGSFILYYVDGRYDTMDCSVSSDGINFSPGNCTIYGFTEKKHGILMW